MASHNRCPMAGDPTKRRIVERTYPLPVHDLTAEVLPMLEDHCRDPVTDYCVTDHLPGPLQAPGADKDQVILEYNAADKEGTTHVYWQRVQDEFCGGDRSANIAVPIVSRERGKRPFITNQVVLSHPDDCMRIASRHVRKQPNFESNGFFDSIISDRQPSHWRKQRKHFSEAFMPIQSLARILPVTVARARRCVDRLRQLATHGDADANDSAPSPSNSTSTVANVAVQPQAALPHAVNMNDFFLHETQAQLQLALFGETEEFMSKTNDPVRRAFHIDRSEYLRDFLVDLVERMESNRDKHSTPSEALATGCPVHGPVSKLIADSGEPFETKYGNAFIFAFAGHDTTGHTLTWLVFELCRHPDIQKRLQHEVDEFWKGQHNQDTFEYDDLQRLPLMTRCIMETLRLWPAVPSGTYRELQFDDECVGPGGSKVRLPKGTFVQISNWMRHRNPTLWGPDVLEFNPDRDFRPDEVWGDQGFAAYNPATERFSPFTFQPRDCIGKNFAHMEMRAILLFVLRDYSFDLSGPYRDTGAVFGVNKGTMGPADLRDGVVDNPSGMALQCHVIPRRWQASL